MPSCRGREAHLPDIRELVSCCPVCYPVPVVLRDGDILPLGALPKFVSARARGLRKRLHPDIVGHRNRTSDDQTEDPSNIQADMAYQPPNANMCRSSNYPRTRKRRTLSFFCLVFFCWLFCFFLLSCFCCWLA